MRAVPGWSCATSAASRWSAGRPGCHGRTRQIVSEPWRPDENDRRQCRIRAMNRGDPNLPDETQAANGEGELRDEGPMIVATVRLPGCSPERAPPRFPDPDLPPTLWRG